jgi:peptidoglycan/xylan/chitin deacetylase (PgdA/CDA1 family)
MGMAMKLIRRGETLDLPAAALARELATMSRPLSVRAALKEAVAAALTSAGLERALRAARRFFGGPRVHLFGYHRVVETLRDHGPGNPALCITADSFRRQVEQIRRRYVVLPLDLAVRAIRGEIDLPGDACAITFDDGYRDVAERAMPILAELEVPATVFVPSGYVGDERPLLHDRLYAALWSIERTRLDLAGASAPTPLRRLLHAASVALRLGGAARAVEDLLRLAPTDMLEQLELFLVEMAGVRLPIEDGARVLDPAGLRTLAQAGWEIGSHTIGHVILTHEPPDRVTAELERSRLDLETLTEHRCRFFAYCNGLYHPALIEAVRRAGYTAAVTTCDRPNRVGDDPFRLSRKVLWEGHTRGARGRWSEAISAAHIADLFGLLGLTTPKDGEVLATPEAPAW